LSTGNLVISGCAGSVTLTGRGARIAAFAADLIHEIYDATGFSSAGYRQNQGGLKSCSGSASGFLTKGSASDTPNFSALACEDLGEEITLVCDTGCQYNFLANITSIHIEEMVGDNAKISFSFMSTGPIEESWVVS